jgi:glycosyltransferase involved in cell wall biosynthesis
MSTISNFDCYKDNFVVVHAGSDKPQISIVMPVYNCEEFVTDAVVSVLSQQQVVAEILISDDASTDNTFFVAYKTVVHYISQFETKHTVSMRIGSSRLIRDHLHLIVNQASCDVVCQAHGDDISHPLRCSVLINAFNQTDKNISMIFVDPLIIDYQGKELGEPKNFSLSNIKVEAVKYTDAITTQNEILIGSNMAWRKSSFKDFPSLTTSYCTYGHDRVMTFRSFLVGGCYVIDAPLLKRRLHKNQLHKELISFEHKTINFFNFQLIRLSVFSAIKNDLIFLKENNLIEENKVDWHIDKVDNMILQTTKFLTSITGELVADGYVNKWIKESSCLNT